MARDKDYKEAGGNMDDFYKNKSYNEDYDDEKQNINFDEMDEESDSYHQDEVNLDAEDLEDKWYGIEDEYRERYPNLTDKDVTVEPNRFRQTLERIGRRRGKSYREILNEIQNW